jgi:transcriptional regulator of heat shock response
LQSLIQEYVASAHPVASSTLARYYVPRLSPATVRNELSWLEDRGYVAQPHTSAGRMPTTTGYRTFVNSLLLYPQQSGSQQLGTPALRKTVRCVTNGLSGRVSRSDTSLPVSSPLPALAALTTTSDRLAHIYDTLAVLAEHSGYLMVFWAPQLSGSIIHRGLPLLLSQPEFAESSAALPLMQLLESHGDLMAVFEDAVILGGLHIRIGSEHKDAQLYGFSLVAMRFDCAHLGGTAPVGTGAGVGAISAGNKAKNYGVVALFGPTRMDYEWAIASISSLVRDLEASGRQ